MRNRFNVVFRMICMIVLTAILQSVNAETFRVDDSNVNDVLANAQPGDEIVFTNGYYSGLQISINSSGTEESPIILRADSTGKVIFTGTGSSLRFFGNWVIVEGFRWFNVHKKVSTPVILFKGAKHNVFRNNEIYNSGAIEGSSSRGVIRVMNTSQNNIIENNRFEHSLSMGIQVWCWDDDTNNTDNIIRNNHFLDHIGYEVLQLGQGSNSAFVDQRTLVENNLFENITMQDPELISCKTSKNIIRHNTFRNCNSMLVLRTGAGTIVDGNWFLNSHGIRIHDRDHVIINNYIEGLPSVINSDNEGITIYSGNMERPNTDGSHYAVKNVLIANNTVINHTAEHIQIGRNANNWQFAPDSCTIENNLVVNDSGIGIDFTVGTNFTFSKNMVWSTGTGTNGNAPDMIVSDPLFEKDDIIYRLQAASPAIDSALVDTLVHIDIEGQARGEFPDIGADEVSADSVLYTPLNVDDIGPSDMPERKEFSLDTKVVGDGSVSIEPEGPVYLEGTVVKVTPVAAEGFYFYCWRGNAMSNKIPYYVKMDDNKSVTAVFYAYKNNTFIPTDDAYIGGGENGDGNWGDSKKLYVRNTENEKNMRKTLLKFDLRKEDYSHADHAILRLYVNNIYNESTCPFVIYNVDDNWKEYDVTWNTAPAVISTIDSFRISTTKAYAEFDITDCVNSELENDDIISISLWDTTQSNAVAYFKSKEESSELPELVLTSISDVSENIAGIADKFLLDQNYPNPFNAGTTIKYGINKPGNVLINIYNIKGELISRLVDGFKPAGEYTVKWNGSTESGISVSSGVYFYSIEFDSFVLRKKMIMLK